MLLGAQRGAAGGGASDAEGAADAVLTSVAVRIYLATGATDLRHQSMDCPRWSASARERFALDPLSGHLPCLAIGAATG